MRKLLSSACLGPLEAGLLVLCLALAWPGIERANPNQPEQGPGQGTSRTPDQRGQIRVDVSLVNVLAGVLDKFFQTYCLVDQGFVKRNSEVSVKEHVAQIGKQLGDEITIRRFVRFQVGESA